MITDFNDYLLEYRHENTILNDDFYLSKIEKTKTKNQALILLYNWMNKNKIDLIYFIRIMNKIYNLNINFNQYFEDSEDKIINKLKTLFKTTKSNLTFKDFSKKVQKII